MRLYRSLICTPSGCRTATAAALTPDTFYHAPISGRGGVVVQK